MQEIQEALHPDDHDYREGSPHLKHAHLFDLIVSNIRKVVTESHRTGIEPWVLDVGSGEGSFVEPVLSAGYRVTAVEMSRPSIEALSLRFGSNEKFEVVLDTDGSLSSVRDRRFSVVTYIAVLHHIPDYMDAIDRTVSEHLLHGGSFVCFQDPLWYPTVPGITRRATQVAYFSWRLTQGSLLRGLRTRWRRLRGVYDESNPVDMAEYHVIRNGVNQMDILAYLEQRFESITLVQYWSTQSSMWQRLGDGFGLKNTFGVIAEGYKS